MRARSHWKFSSRKFPYLKNPSMLRFMQTLPINHARCEDGFFALAICRPSQKSIAVVEKRSAANGGFQAPQKTQLAVTRRFFRSFQERMLQYSVTTTAKKTTKVRELKSMDGPRLLI